MMFFSQYKKIIALCAIPIAVAVTFLGYQVIHAQSTRTGVQTVNTQMQALLDAELKPTANNTAPSDAALSQPSNAPSDAAPSQSSNAPTESLSPVVTRDPSTTTSRSTAKPKRTNKPKATKKPRATKRSTPAPNPNFKININQATAIDLEKLPGIGASKAKAIIAYREQSNAFKTLEELMKVKGIGPKIYEKIKVHLEL
jgi:competence protein ComEA